MSRLYLHHDIYVMVLKCHTIVTILIIQFKTAFSTNLKICVCIFFVIRYIQCTPNFVVSGGSFDCTALIQPVYWTRFFPRYIGGFASLVGSSLPSEVSAPRLCPDSVAMNTVPLFDKPHYLSATFPV